MPIRFPRRTPARRRLAVIALAVLVVVPILAVPIIGRAARPTSTGSPGGSGAPPSVGHVFVIVMENEEQKAIIGNDKAPYINSLASKYALAANYSAITHPSQPNYLAMWSGATQVSDDRVHSFTTGTTLADQIEQSGRTWHVAAENVQQPCFNDATSSGGEDGPGEYARKHEPAISWTSVSDNAQRCSNITDFSHFDPNLGNFWFIVPNLCHDMHDCSIAKGDAWLQGWLPKILDSSAFQDSVVYLTWDEGTTKINGGGNVATLVIGPRARPGFSSDTPHDHYSLLRTIENAWGLPCIENSCSANDLRELFQ